MASETTKGTDDREEDAPENQDAAENTENADELTSKTAKKTENAAKIAIKLEVTEADIEDESETETPETNPVADAEQNAKEAQNEPETRHDAINPEDAVAVTEQPSTSKPTNSQQSLLKPRPAEPVDPIEEGEHDTQQEVENEPESMLVEVSPEDAMAVTQGQSSKPKKWKRKPLPTVYQESLLKARKSKRAKKALRLPGHDYDQSGDEGEDPDRVPQWLWPCAVCKLPKNPEDREGVSFHTVPKNPTTREEWERAFKRNLPVHGKVCSRHFRPEEIIRDLKNELLGGNVKHSLKKGAVPSRHLLGTGEFTAKEKARIQREEERRERMERRERKELVDKLLKESAAQAQAAAAAAAAEPPAEIELQPPVFLDEPPQPQEPLQPEQPPQPPSQPRTILVSRGGGRAQQILVQNLPNQPVRLLFTRPIEPQQPATAASKQGQSVLLRQPPPKPGQQPQIGFHQQLLKARHIGTQTERWFHDEIQQSEIKVCKSQIQALQIRLSKEKKLNMRLTSEKHKLKLAQDLITKRFSPAHANFLLGKKYQKKQWTHQEMQNAALLHKMSPKIYSFLRFKGMMALPGDSTVLKWSRTQGDGGFVSKEASFGTTAEGDAGINPAAAYTRAYAMPPVVARKAMATSTSTYTGTSTDTATSTSAGTSTDAGTSTGTAVEGQQSNYVINLDSDSDSSDGEAGERQRASPTRRKPPARPEREVHHATASTSTGVDMDAITITYTSMADLERNLGLALMESVDPGFVLTSDGTQGTEEIITLNMADIEAVPGTSAMAQVRPKPKPKVKRRADPMTGSPVAGPSWVSPTKKRVRVAMAGGQTPAPKPNTPVVKKPTLPRGIKGVRAKREMTEERRLIMREKERNKYRGKTKIFNPRLMQFIGANHISTQTDETGDTDE